MYGIQYFCSSGSEDVQVSVLTTVRPSLYNQGSTS